MIEPSHSARLAGLIAEAHEVATHSAFLVRRARALCVQSTEDRGERQAHQEARRAWAELLARLPGDPDHVVVLCAWCHRVKGVRLWHHLPVGIEYELRAWDRVLLSHGYCPDCLRTQETEWQALHLEPPVSGPMP